MSNSSPALRGGWFDRLIDLLAFVAGATLCVLTLLICIDVFARYFRLFSMPWSLDAAEYALLVVTFFGAPWVLRDNAHIAIDILVERFSEAARGRISRVSHGVGAAVCAVLLLFATRAWWSSFSQGTTVHETFVYPEWILYAIPPPVFLMMIVIFARWLIWPETHRGGVDMTTDGI